MSNENGHFKSELADEPPRGAMFHARKRGGKRWGAAIKRAVFSLCGIARMQKNLSGHRICYPGRFIVAGVAAGF